MRTNQFQVPKWRNITVFRAAAVALATGAIAAPAVSHAEKVWDIGQYDSCVAAANNRYQSGKTDVTTWGKRSGFAATGPAGSGLRARGARRLQPHSRPNCKRHARSWCLCRAKPRCPDGDGDRPGPETLGASRIRA